MILSLAELLLPDILIELFFIQILDIVSMPFQPIHIPLNNLLLHLVLSCLLRLIEYALSVLLIIVIAWFQLLFFLRFE